MKDHFFPENSNHCFTTITEFSEELENEIENEEYQYDLMKEEVHNVISFVWS